MITLVHVTTVPDTLHFFRGQVGYLKERGFRVHAVSSPGPLAQDFELAEGVVVHRVVMARRMAPLADLKALLHLHQIFRSVRPTIVHSHTPKAGLLGTLAARLAGVPVIYLSIFGLPQMTRSGPARRLLDLTTYIACACCHRVWCDSFSMRDEVSRTALCPTDKIAVLGHGSVNGVDAERAFSPDLFGLSVRDGKRAHYGIPSAARVIGFVGRVVKDKGMHELACAWRSIREHYADVHLLLVGPLEALDPILPEDETLFREDPRVHLAGRQSDVAAHLASMDVFVLPSHREGFGVVNIEAAAMELPVVCTRIPGCVDSVKDGFTGTLVPVNDSRALEQAICTYLDDEALRRRHGQAGRERVLRDFRPESIWQAIHEDYLKMLQRRRMVGESGASFVELNDQPD